MQEKIEETLTEIDVKTAKTKPDLEKTEKALKEIEGTDFMEKVGSEPPEWFLTIMEAVMTLLKKPTDWNSIEIEIKNHVQLIRNLSLFDKDNIPQEVIDKIQPFIEREDFVVASEGMEEKEENGESLKGSDQLAKRLCQWVHAMHQYHTYLQIVRPL